METLTGRYRLLEPLGSGGMSVVWRGYDEVLGRLVAVKVLAAEFADDAEFRSRIRREAQAAARLSHPHITNVFDYGEAADGTPYVVMELVPGPSLAQRLADGPLPWELVVKIGAEVAGALAAAHRSGLVHRDVKPANVMLSPSGAKVVDFGISAIVGEHGSPVVLGTPGYLAPEQRAGAPAQPATDVYALGLLLSRALPPGEPVPVELRELIGQCLSRQPADRPAGPVVATRLAAISSGAHAAARVSMSPRNLMPPPGRRGHRGTRVMPAVPPPPPLLRPDRPRRWPVLATAAVLVFLACLAGASLIDRRHAGRTGSTPAAAAPASATPAAPSPSPSPSPAAGCRIGYQITDYKIGFQARVTLTNSGAAGLSGWTLAFDFPDRQKLGVGWGGIWKQQGSRITVTDMVVNRSVPPGRSVDLGFVGTYQGKNGRPQNFSVNDVQCDQSDG